MVAAAGGKKASGPGKTRYFSITPFLLLSSARAQKNPFEKAILLRKMNSRFQSENRIINN
jgi:hypothetical protein